MGEKPGLSGAAFFDLYTDPREESGKMLQHSLRKGMFNGSLTLYAGAKSPAWTGTTDYPRVARSGFTFAPTGRGGLVLDGQWRPPLVKRVQQGS